MLTAAHLQNIHVHMHVVFFFTVACSSITINVVQVTKQQNTFTEGGGGRYFPWGQQPSFCCSVTLTVGGGRGGSVHVINNLHCAVTLTKAGMGGSWGQQPSLRCDTDQGRDCWGGSWGRQHSLSCDTDQGRDCWGEGHGVNNLQCAVTLTRAGTVGG